LQLFVDAITAVEERLSKQIAAVNDLLCVVEKTLNEFRKKVNE
jgi:hypothetical protein